MFKTLIVEDHASYRRLLKEIVNARFPRMLVAEAADGKEAMERVAAIRPDFITMDIKLPGESGLELTRRIKAEYPQTVILVLTSYDLPEYRQAAYQFGADYFLSKASLTEEKIEELFRKVSRELGLDLNSNGSEGADRKGKNP